MGHYIIHFTVYLLAMTGVIFIAFVVWKNATTFKGIAKKSGMKIEDSLNLSPRKTLYIIRIQNERFLIASDVDKTTLLSKLEEGKSLDFEAVQKEIEENDVKDEITKKIKLKEEVIEENKPKNILQELMKNNGIGR